MIDAISVFAPASTGNIGPGFDLLGMALSGMGDTVTAVRRAGGGVFMESITGDGGKLPLDAEKNTAGIAAQAVLSHLGCGDGVVLTLQKEIPGTGLGSSAASAVAAAVAVNLLFGQPLTKGQLIPLAAVAESKVSGGFFLDNIGPSMMGGITWNNPFTREIVPLGHLAGAVIVLAIPDVPLLTKDSRRVLPAMISMEQFISNMAYASLMTWSVAVGDVTRFGRAILDRVAEPQRAPLIQGFGTAKSAALSAGAFGCSISGAGASLFAVTDNTEAGQKIAAAMQDGFAQAGVSSQVRVTTIDPLGARAV